MERRQAAVIALAVALAASGCTVGYQPAADAPERSAPPADEPLGYYDGYWYNDTFDFDPEAGLSEGEFEAVVARAMARIQLLRGLRFESDVDVDLITREQFREEFGSLGGDPSEPQRRLENAQYEALFLVGPDEDVVEAARTNRGSTILGFYVPAEDRLVVVSEADPPTLHDELTLAHELVHALQDQRFGIGSVGATTLDGVNARNGLIEGDATVVERAYARNCETGSWQCVSVATGDDGGLPADFHWGVYFLGYFPYAEGPSFVEHHRERGGWGAVDGIYEARPTTSAEIIAPETYGDDAYGGATLPDRSDDEWERIAVGGGEDAGAASVGRAGIATMFAYTAYAGDAPGVIDRDDFRNAGPGGLNRTRPYTYDVPRTEGWRADRLYAYRRGEETAYVWNVTFATPGDAADFRAGYAAVAEHWGGERVAPGVWTLDGRFRGAVATDRDGVSVTVVKAPSRSALGDVHAPAADRVPAD